MKRLTNQITSFTLLIVVLVLLIVFPFGCSKKEPEAKEVKIGAILPMTGQNAIDGEAARQAIELAVEEKGNELTQENIQVKVVYEDDKMEPKEGVSAAKKLISVNKVLAIIGPFGSSVVLAVSPVAEQNKVVLISGSATNPKIKDSGDYIFRVVPPDDYQGKALSKFAYEVLKAKKGAILYINNDYGVGLKSVIERDFPELGGELAFSEGFNPGETDFRTYLLKLKNLNPECVFIPSHPTEGGIILRQSREMGLQVPFLGGDGIFRPELIELASNAANNTYVSSMSWRPDSAQPLVRDFVAKFKEKYGKEPNVFSAYYFDATAVILEAILNGCRNSEAIKSYLYEIDFVGVTGKTKFDRYGEVEKPIDIYKVQDNAFRYVSTVQL